MNNRVTPATWAILGSEAPSQRPGTKARYIFFYYPTEIQNGLAYAFYCKDSWLRDKEVETKGGRKRPDSEGDLPHQGSRSSLRGAAVRGGENGGPLHAQLLFSSGLFPGTRHRVARGFKLLWIKLMSPTPCLEGFGNSPFITS